MAARALKDLDAAVPPLTRALTLEIRTAHRSAGSPSFTHLDTRNVRAGRGTLAKSTLSRILTPDPTAKDQSLPAWSYYEGLLYALDVDPAPFQPQWQAAQEEWQARSRGESPDLPAVLQPVSVGVLQPTLLTPTLLAPAPPIDRDPRRTPPRRRHPLLIPASIAGSAAAIVAISAFAFIGGTPHTPPKTATPPAPNTDRTTAILVTNAPPTTIPGKIVRTWNQDANNGHGGSIGVEVFPTPYSLTHSVGPHHDGDLVEVVCHTPHGRLTHERLDTNHENSTGWYEIYFEDRLWWVPDHYVGFAPGAQVPDCGS
ncbi:hypothetical protein Caci_6247 [Catenulispora acidiphila DSM 44928]|uniref:Uncharacterized protein n=1 Tax=Catenulispora acidiphila (strain DSM 44928 / JCM 14897 / NBRC 102108 / NRRL B-24433 / ID139908) TaxID=479433 RepID=C7QK27_CATAD|nr:hypothetical protein [Catenulispora acidiphila]ACU75101.1 hypothetical protein Caci_6247 [Catenulispora acidiphila DSM 44928]